MAAETGLESAACKPPEAGMTAEDYGWGIVPWSLKESDFVPHHRGVEENTLYKL